MLLFCLRVFCSSPSVQSMDEIMDKTCPSMKFSSMDGILFPHNLSPNEYFVFNIMLFQPADFFRLHVLAASRLFELDQGMDTTIRKYKAM